MITAVEIYACIMGAMLVALIVLAIWNPRHKTADELWDELG